MLLQQDLTGIETKSLDEDTQKNIAMFTGTASTAEKDLTDDIIEAGAFGEIDPKFVRLLRDHDMRKPIGKWHKFEQKGKKLLVEGEIGLDFETGLETYKLMKHDYINGLSVGFRLKKGGIRYDDEADVRYIKSATLLECSIVSIPANQNARTHGIKSLTRDDWREWLRDYGLRDADVDIVMKHGFDALLEKRKRINITEIDGHREMDVHYADLATEVRRYAQTLRGQS
jgi:HK97 family phage prohead protease